MVSMDRAGRIVIPKDVRERLSIEPDAALSLNVEGGSIRLTPERGPTRMFRLIDGFPVFESVGGRLLTDSDVQRLRDGDQR